MSKAEMIQEAVTLAKLGFAVFPCHSIRAGKCTCGKSDCKSPGKHPRTANGFYAAVSDPAAVEKLFDQFSESNIGIATGPASGVWVLDIESEGVHSWAGMLSGHEQPNTPIVSTGGGGIHIYFRYNGREIRNKEKTGGKAIDVRGIGGYVIAPPSKHISGKPYWWTARAGELSFAEAPAWILDLVTETAKPVSSPLVVQVQSVPDDLATAPGAGEGQRHGTALKLIGSAIGRGVDQLEIMRQATAWAARCIPPMADDEVLKIVADLSKRQAAQPPVVVAANDEAELPPLPKQEPWPVLDQDALTGLGGEIVKAIEPETEADPVAILAQSFVSFGNLVGRAPFFQVEGTWHHCNLFAVLVGKTSRGRKGTSEGRSRQILRFVDEEWATNNIKTGLVSGEGLIFHVRDPVYKLEQIKERGRVVGTEEVLADPGVGDKRLLVIEPEFASVLRVCRRETNTLSPTLRSAWDTGNLRTLAKNIPAKATKAHISIIGHITAEELRRALSEADSFNGFANRFLWLAVKRSKLLPDGGRDLDLTGFAKRLSEAATAARAIEQMNRSRSAAALWRKVYPDLAGDGASGMFGAVTSRAEAQVLRLSMVYALIDGSAVIDDQHLRAALALWSYCRDSARLIFGAISCDQVAERLMEIIRGKPGINRRGLHEATGKHIKAAAMVLALTTLRDSGRARVEIVKTGGRDSERWYPIDDCSQIVRNCSQTTGTAATVTGKELSEDCSLNSLCSQLPTGNGMIEVEI
jgi:hypothetical protein